MNKLMKLARNVQQTRTLTCLVSHSAKRAEIDATDRAYAVPMAHVPAVTGSPGHFARSSTPATL